jgi:uncharacterized protein DUF6496
MEVPMPEKETLKRARADKRAGKSPSTQAGEFVREEIHHVREGKHGATSAKQAIAIGLSKARKAGVRLPPRGKRRASTTTRRRRPSPKRSRAVRRALKRQPGAAASHAALSRQARRAAAKRRTRTTRRRRRTATA